MREERSRAWRDVDLDALAHNARALQGALAPGCRLMAVVKADAYGHGAFPVAHRLEQEGVEAFAVACLAEGMESRELEMLLHLQDLIFMIRGGNDQQAADIQVLLAVLLLMRILLRSMEEAETEQADTMFISNRQMVDMVISDGLVLTKLVDMLLVQKV